ncbi:30S ribosomal protein S9 [Candidatus Parcubacteria bacterium]|nr:30S ribosomal protein S9 [Candidatus Parcubacteria bacterium]
MDKTKQAYIETVGRRKTSVARARLEESGKQSFTVNDQPLEEYFKTEDLRATVLSALNLTETTSKFKVTVRVMGGGVSSQAVAVRHAISRALVEGDRDLRSPLKKQGYLKRDPRMKERRKFGLKKARKAAQWAKR